MSRTNKIIWTVFLSIMVLWIFSFIFASSTRVTGEKEMEERGQQYINHLRNKVNPYGGSTKPEAGFSMPGYGKQNVTFSQYNQIQTGMTYEQVVSIIGKHGEEMSQNRMEGVPGVMPSITTIMYQWVNENGSNMNAIFQNNALIQKAQFGLK